MKTMTGSCLQSHACSKVCTIFLLNENHRICGDIEITGIAIPQRSVIRHSPVIIGLRSGNAILRDSPPHDEVHSRGKAWHCQPHEKVGGIVLPLDSRPPEAVSICLQLEIGGGPSIRHVRNRKGVRSEESRRKPFIRLPPNVVAIPNIDRYLPFLPIKYRVTSTIVLMG